MPTDPARIKRTDPGDPKKCNVYTFHKTFGQDEDTLNWVQDGCSSASIGCVDCKKKLLEKMGVFFEPIHKRRAELSDDYILDIAHSGSKKASERAKDTLDIVNSKMNLVI